MKLTSSIWMPLIFLALLAVLLGCADTIAEAKETEPARFIVEEVGLESAWAGQYAFILTDTETGTQYLYLRDSGAGGMTKLEPAPEKEAQP